MASCERFSLAPLGLAVFGGSFFLGTIQRTEQLIIATFELLGAILALLFLACSRIIAIVAIIATAAAANVIIIFDPAAAYFVVVLFLLDPVATVIVVIAVAICD